MKNRNVQIVLAAVLLMSCNKNEVVIEGGDVSGIPSYSSTLNTFSYSITAQRLTGTQTIPLTFNKNRLFISAAVSNLTQGQAIFALRDQANSLIHADTFRLTGTYQVLMVVGMPGSVTITFQNLTAGIQYALVADSLIPSMNIEDFPNTHGSSWVYMRHDSLANVHDTMRVEVGGQVLLPGNIPATVWKRSYSSGVPNDSLYVTISADTVRIFLYYPQWHHLKFVFPLSAGKRWNGVHFSHTCTVSRTGTVTTYAGTFESGYFVEEDWGGPNVRGYAGTWTVPHVGIVDMYRWGIDLGPGPRDRWQLLSYNVVAGE